jgi:anti-anti-sigma factor
VPLVQGSEGKINEENMISLLLVDDQPIVRRGLRMRLMFEPDITVVGEASSGEQALELVKSLAPDIVLMDVEMPGMNGITATEAIHANSLQSAVVMMSIHDDSQTRARAEAAGAAAFVEKRGAVEVLLATIRQVAAPGRTWKQLRTYRIRQQSYERSEMIQQTDAIFHLHKNLTTMPEQLLTQANSATTSTIVLNCSELEPINSHGIRLLILLLIYTRRQQKRLFLFGLSEHNRYILQITRLSEFIEIVSTQTQTLATVHMVWIDTVLLQEEQHYGP